MELAIMLQHLWRHRILAALGVLIAALIAISFNYDVSSSGLKSKQSESSYGAAQSQFYVDTSRPTLVTSQAQAPDLISRARIVASFISSGQVRSAMGRAVGVPSALISVTGPTPDQAGAQGTQPVAQQRANQIISEGSVFSVYVDTDLTSSTITLFVQAPNRNLASRLAAAVPAALTTYLNTLYSDELPNERSLIARRQVRVSTTRARRAQAAARNERLDEIQSGRTVVRALGNPISGTVTTQSGRAIGLLVFVVVVLAIWLAIVLLSAARERRRRE